MADHDSMLIGKWMADPEMVDPVGAGWDIGWDAGTIGVMQCVDTYAKLHLLPGFDLPEFLAGTRLAYETVTRLMLSRDWELLEPLVASECLDAMVIAMDGLSSEARRVMDHEADDAVRVNSATLCRVLIPDDPEWSAGEPRKVHLE